MSYKQDIQEAQKNAGMSNRLLEATTLSRYGERRGDKLGFNTDRYIRI